MELLAFTLNSFSFSCNSAPGKPTFEMICIARAGEDDGEAKDTEKDPG